MAQVKRVSRWLTVASALAVGAPASALGPVEEAQLVELDRVRAEVAGEVQLAAYDLVDELVHGWVADPIFQTPTPVVLADVTVPVGLGTGLQALLENHIASVLLENPTTNLELVHCPSCTAVVVHSGPDSTVVARGIDDPAVLAQVGGATGKHALFIDVEAEGAWLVLRARVTQLNPDLPIVWSHTLATSASTPALLRQPDDLKSSAEARQEYIDVLHDRGSVAIPLRFVVRSYAQPNSQAGIAPPPFLWLQSGVELGTTDAQAWTSSLLLGYSVIPNAYQGLMGQARLSRLLTGRARSHTRPDLYGFVGGAVMTVWGPATAPFKDTPLNADDLIATLLAQGPRSTFSTLHFGVELRLGNRIALSEFLETLPSLRNSDNLGPYVRLAGIEFQSMGTEVTFCF